MKASRPYARLMRQVIGHIAQANSEYKHPFLVERAKSSTSATSIVSTDRGLCGGLNSNLFRTLLGEHARLAGTRASRSTWSASARRPRRSSAA